MLIVCNENAQCVDDRLKQIEQYRQLGACSRGAEMMLKIKKMFKLSGDFSPVEMLVDLVSIYFRSWLFKVHSSVSTSELKNRQIFLKSTDN